MSNNKVLFWSFTVALGGFHFGFDTAVISRGGGRTSHTKIMVTE